MIAATLFSGIGAPEVAMPEWDWRWHAEIERFPSAVMAARHAHSINLGDVTAHDFIDRALAFGRPDVVVFGSPCQSYSVAGKRLGLDDPRGNLALIALGIVERLRPTWFVFENVPGLFSSWSGGPAGLSALEIERLHAAGTYAREFIESSDFAAFISGVSTIRYYGAWGVLDAQYRGLAQRRDRVFFVGHSRDWRRAAAVLLEPESLCGDPPSRGQARQDVARPVAPSLTGSGRGASRIDESRGQDPLVVGALTDGSKMGGGRNGQGAYTGRIIAVPAVAPCLTGNYGKQADNSDTNAGPMLVAHTLKADGFDASEDGTGRGVPLVPVSYSIGSHAGAADGEASNRSHAAGGPTGMGISEEQSHTLCSGRVPAVAVTSVFDPNQITSPRNGSQPTPELSHALPAQGQAPIAFTMKDHGADAGEISPTLRSGGHDKSHANGGVAPAIAYSVAFRGREGGTQAELGGEVSTALRGAGGSASKAHILSYEGQGNRIHSEASAASTLTSNPAGGPKIDPVFAGSGVRRLMPVECERLQGFPDHYTAIDYRSKPAADGPRYKAIGNSMAVPVIRWILARIEWLDAHVPEVAA